MEHRARFTWIKWIDKVAPYRINYIALRHGDIPGLDFWGKWIFIRDGLKTLINGDFEAIDDFPKVQSPNS